MPQGAEGAALPARKEPAHEGNEGWQLQQSQRVGGARQELLKAIVSKSPAKTTAALCQQLKTVTEKAQTEIDRLHKTLGEKEEEVLLHRERAEKAEKSLQSVEDRFARERLENEKLEAEIKEKTGALATALAINKGLKHVIASRRRDEEALEAWDDEPATGWNAPHLLHPVGGAVVLPRQEDMLARWSAGLLRDVFLAIKANDCACKREFAANALTQTMRPRFENMTLIGEGACGVIRSARCLKTKKVYAVKSVREGCPATELINEMIAFSVVSANDHIITVECISDVAGSEGIIMELALCDMLKACTGTSDHVFPLSQQINFEADASEGLAHMHGAGVIHCDHKPQNVLICRCDGRTGFVGKITDPGLWCGWGEMRGKMSGTPGWIPLENVLDDVRAAPVQDIFASAVNACFVVTRDDIKTKSGNMWSHPSLLNPEEVERLRKLKAEGRDSTILWEEIFKRVMLDGSFSSKFLKPVNLHPALPPSELTNVCDVLKNALSGDPRDRPQMTALTVFLRNLAWDTGEREREIAALPPGIDLPQPGVPVISSSSDDSSEDTSSEGTVSLGGDSARGMDTLPRVAAPHAEEGGIDDGAGAGAAAVPPPGEAAVEAEGGPALVPLAVAVNPPAEAANNEIIMAPALDEIAPPVVPSIEGVHLAHPPPIVVAPHAEQAEEHDDGAGAVAVPPPAEAAVEAAVGDSVLRGSALPDVDVDPSVEAANNAVIMPPALAEIVPPVAPSMEGVHLAHPPIVNNAAILPDLDETAPPVVHSMERVQLAHPPPVVAAPHTEQAEQVGEDDNGAGAAAMPPPSEASVEAARSELAMHGSATHAEHAEDHDGGADTVAAVPPPAEAAVQAATSNSATHGPAPPPVAHPPVDAEPADEGAEPAMDAHVLSIEGEIGGRLNLAPNPLLLRPFPGSPAEIMATYVAGTLRTPLGGLPGISNVPLAPAAWRPLAGQGNRGGGCVVGVGGVLSGGGVVSGGGVLSGGNVVGGGGGDGGVGVGGGGRRFGGGREKGKGRWKWWR